MTEAKEKPLLGGEGLHKRIEKEYAAEGTLQAAWLGWQHEAARLLREFWRTANRKHLEAFFTHVAAMRAYKERLT